MDPPPKVANPLDSKGLESGRGKENGKNCEGIAGGGQSGSDDLLYETLICIEQRLGFRGHVEDRHLLRQLDAGVALAGVGKLDHAHIEKHLVVPVEQLLHGGIECIQSILRGLDGKRFSGLLGNRLGYAKDVFSQVDDIGELRLSQAGKVKRLKLLAGVLLVVLAGVASDDDAMRIERDVEGIGDNGQRMRGLGKVGVIQVKPNLGSANTCVESNGEPVGPEDVLNDGALVGVQVKAAQAGLGRKQFTFSQGACSLLVDGNWPGHELAVIQLMHVLGSQGALGVQFEGVREGSQGSMLIQRLRSLAAS